MMNRFMRQIGLAWCCLLALPGVSAAKTVVDIYQRSVVVPDHPQRIFLGESRLLFSLALVREGDPSRNVVGWPGDMAFYDAQSWRAFTARWPQIAAIPTTGAISFAQTSVEKILALRPDLAILPRYAREQPGRTELEAQLTKAGVPYLYVDFRIDQLHNTVPGLLLLGKVLNSEQKAQRFARYYQAHMQRVADALSRPHGSDPKVMLQLHLGKKGECCVTVSHGNLADLMAFAGGNNIAGNKFSQVYGQMNPEAVIAADPDIYITTGTSSAEDKRGIQLGWEVSQQQAQASLRRLLAQEPLLSQLPAVQRGNAWSLWHNFYISPLHVVAVEFFARTFHPQQFADLNPEDTLQTIFSEFMDMPSQGTFWSQP